MSTPQSIEALEQLQGIVPKEEATRPRHDPSPQSVAIDQYLCNVDERLFRILQFLGTSRTKLYEARRGLANFDQAYREERNNHLECAQAYQTVCAHNQALQQLNVAKDNQIKEYHQRLIDRNASRTIPDDSSDAGWDQIELALKKHELENQISNIEAQHQNEKERLQQEHLQEKARLVEEHQILLRQVVAEHEHEKSKMIDEYQTEKLTMVEEHRSALTHAANCIIASNEKIHELNLRQDQLQDSMQSAEGTELPNGDRLASQEIGKSSTIGKREHSEGTGRPAPAKKGRKRRA